MTTTKLVRFPLALGCALSLLATHLATSTASADPLSFTLFNPSNSNQSRLNISATATLDGTALTEGPQVASGGLNGNGSESTLYAQTTSNTPSNIAANLHLSSIAFPTGGEAQAANTAGSLGNNLALSPGVGGASGTAPGDYGILFSSAQSTVIPPIDVSSLGISGLTTLNLGTLSAVNLNVALRDFALDFTSPPISLTPGNNTYPSQFDASQVGVNVTANADMSLTATLTQANLTDWLTTGAALIALQQALSAQGITITETGKLSNLSYQVGFGFTSAINETDVANNNAGLGTVEHIGTNLRLTLPVNFNVQPTIPSPVNTLITAANFNLTGNLIGQTPFVTVPEPSSVVLALAGFAGAVLVFRRRR